MSAGLAFCFHAAGSRVPMMAPRVRQPLMTDIAGAHGIMAAKLGLVGFEVRGVACSRAFWLKQKPLLFSRRSIIIYISNDM